MTEAPLYPGERNGRVVHHAVELIAACAVTLGDWVRARYTGRCASDKNQAWDEIRENPYGSYGRLPR